MDDPMKTHPRIQVAGYYCWTVAGEGLIPPRPVVIVSPFAIRCNRIIGAVEDEGSSLGSLCRCLHEQLGIIR